MDNIVAFCANSKHAGFCADIPHISPIEIIADLGHGFEINLSILLNVLAMNFDDVEAGGLVGQRDLNFPIKTSRSQQSRVKNVRSVGGHDHFDLTQILETIKLVKELHECSLDFTIG